MNTFDKVEPSPIPAVLIVVYRRFENLEEIVKVIAQATIPRLYLAVDVPPLELQTKEYSLERDASIQKLKQWCQKNKIELFIWVRKNNLGCARSVLTACEWFFRQETFGVILEDDCIPSLEFFEFVSECRYQLENNNDILFICGTQHAEITNFSIDTYYILSSYPFLWGWATSSDRWSQIVDIYLNSEQYDGHSVKSKSETFYWKTGIRRASERRVDVWDTIVVGFMALKGVNAILPLQNLIDNRGLDEYATNHSASEFGKSLKFTLNSHDLQKTKHLFDSVVRDEFFNINRWKPFKNSLRYLLDLLTPSRKLSLRRQLAHDFLEIPPVAINL